MYCSAFINRKKKNSTLKITSSKDKRVKIGNFRVNLYQIQTERHEKSYLNRK